MVAGTVLVVVLRYALDRGAIVLQESVLYLHGITFMLGIPYALKHGAHVRVDLIYSRLGIRGRAVIDLLGHVLFLIPVCIAIIVFSHTYVMNAWRILERSPEVGGLPAVFLLKTLIPLMAALLLLQGLAEITRCIVALRGHRG
jgi:TRAP-type mannitol/chloroaromatic compound transport system permease small subunit